ncbi:MAG: aspartate aminotransferase family protein, partial [Brevibacterium yomogidense]
MTMTNTEHNTSTAAGDIGAEAAAASAAGSATAAGPVTEEMLARGRRAHDLDRKHVFHSWQAQG